MEVSPNLPASESRRSGQGKDLCPACRSWVFSRLHSLFLYRFLLSAHSYPAGVQTCSSHAPASLSWTLGSPLTSTYLVLHVIPATLDGGARRTCARFNKNESWIKKMHLIAALGIDQVTKTHICRIVKFDLF